MKKIPTPSSFKPSSAFKFGASMNNLLLMLLFSFTMFVMFRYMKTLEKDVKRLSEKLERVETHQQLTDTNRLASVVNNAPSTFPQWKQSKDASDDAPPACTRLSEECEIVTTNANSGDGDGDGDGDDESVNTEIMMQMVSDIDRDDENRSAQPVTPLMKFDTHENHTHDVHVDEQQDEIVEVIQDQEDDDFVMKPKEGKIDQESPLDVLKKKTNDELKKILKDKGKSIKGTKQELINRLMEEDA